MDIIGHLIANDDPAYTAVRPYVLCMYAAYVCAFRRGEPLSNGGCSRHACLHTLLVAKTQTRNGRIGRMLFCTFLSSVCGVLPSSSGYSAALIHAARSLRCRSPRPTSARLGAKFAEELGRRPSHGGSSQGSAFAPLGRAPLGRARAAPRQRGHYATCVDTISLHRLTYGLAHARSAFERHSRKDQLAGDGSRLPLAVGNLGRETLEREGEIARVELELARERRHLTHLALGVREASTCVEAGAHLDRTSSGKRVQERPVRPDGAAEVDGVVDK